MNIKLITDHKKLTEWVKSESDLDIAVAFWGEGAIRAFGLDCPGRKVRFIINLDSGGTNPSEIEKLFKQYPKSIKQNGRLHAKAYIGKSVMVLGSANASANGLGLEGAEQSKWDELSLLVDDRATIKNAKTWFETQWEENQSVKMKDIEKAKKTWNERRRTRPISNKQSTANDLFTAALKGDSSVKDRGIMVIVFTKELSESGEKEYNKLEKKVQQKYDKCEFSADILPNTYLISFSDFDNGTITCDGLFKTPSKLQHHGIILLERLDAINGLKIGLLSDWRNALQKIKKADKESYKEMLMDVVTFVQKYGKR